MPTHSRLGTRVPVWPLGACALLSWLCTAGRAHACRVELLGAPSSAWEQAASSLPPAASADADCATLQIEVDDQGARVTFITQDGRRAERRVSQADELAPTVSALRVAPPRSDSLPNDSGHATAAAALEARTPAPVAAETEPPERKLGVLFALLVGARGGDQALLSPVVQSELQARIRRWEVGVNMAWEPRYYDIGNPQGHRHRTLLVPALSFARRQPITRSALLVGARLGLALLFPAYTQTIESPAELGPPLQAQRQEELRAGAFVGVALPRTARLRFRAELAAEFVCWRSALFPPLSDQGFGFVSPDISTPSWALSALVGVEFEGP